MTDEPIAIGVIAERVIENLRKLLDAEKLKRPHSTCFSLRRCKQNLSETTILFLGYRNE